MCGSEATGEPTEDMFLKTGTMEREGMSLELDLDQKEQGPEKVVSKQTSPDVPC